jgi:hypothetical protein
MGTGEASTTYREGQDQLEDLVANGLSGSRLGRSHLLKLAGAGLFGAAVAIFLPNAEPAEAYCGDSSPCYGYELCCGACCVPNRCDEHCNQGWLGCPTGEQCWYHCTPAGKLIKCCDCSECSNCGRCICRFNVGTCTP